MALDEEGRPIPRTVIFRALAEWSLYITLDSGKQLRQLPLRQLQSLDPSSQLTPEELLREGLTQHLSGARPAQEPMNSWFDAWLRSCASDLRVVQGLAPTQEVR